LRPRCSALARFLSNVSIFRNLMTRGPSEWTARLLPAFDKRIPTRPGRDHNIHVFGREFAFATFLTIIRSRYLAPL
jgi:hypothetical protein